MDRRLTGRLAVISLSAAMALAGSGFSFGAFQSLPNGSIVDVGGKVPYRPRRVPVFWLVYGCG